jgi:hypothetical protein
MKGTMTRWRLRKYSLELNGAPIMNRTSKKCNALIIVGSISTLKGRKKGSVSGSR